MKNVKNTSRLVGTFIVMTSITFGHVLAQQPESPSLTIQEGFRSNFENATCVIWKKFDRIYYATFANNGESWIAYLDRSGSLITSGRRVTLNRLPLVVQNNLNEILHNYEKKLGILQPGCIYEMVKSGQTEYFIPFENDHHFITLTSSPNGTITVVAKEIRANLAKIQRDVIAKK